MIQDIEILNLMRFLVGAVVLIYASYTDIKTRTAENYLWVIMAGAGAILLLIQHIFYSISFLDLLFIPVMILLVFLLYQLRLIFGGADAKALMAIAVLFPSWPEHSILPSLMPYSFSVLTNALLVFIAVPFAIFMYNIFKRDIRFPHMFLGYRTSVEKAMKGFVWPMEYVDGGNVRTRYFPSGSNPAGEFRMLKAIGQRCVWVTPKIPFLVPLTFGFIISFIAGDLMFWIVWRIICR